MMDDGCGPSLDNARKAQKIIDEIKEVEGVVSTPSNPFREAAAAEAASDALVGIERDDAWIKQRAKEIYKASKAVKSMSGDFPEYVSRKDLPDLLARLDQCKCTDEATQEAYNKIIAEHYKRSAVAEREIISRESVMQEEIEKRTVEIKKILEENSYQDRMKANKATLTFLRSAMLAILIPIFSMLPGNWKFCQMLPLIGIVWLNWKPMRALRKMMKDLKNERVSPS
jgi:hypothetical protein